MLLKFVQINIYKGKYLEALVDFLKKEDPDFISVQELTYGVMNYFEDKKADLFELLKSRLGLKGVSNFDWKVKDADTSLGNGVFSRYPIKDHHVLTLREAEPVKLAFAESEKGFPTAPRHLIVATCDFNGTDIRVMSWHAAWTAPPTDTEETLRQAEMVRDYLVDLNKGKRPFLLGGDLNSTPDRRTIQMISEVAINTMVNTSIVSTLHPKIHKISPKDLLVDYVFTSKHFELKSIRVPEVTVSDHLPVVTVLEFKSS